MINARIYNYSNLKEEHKKIVQSNLSLLETVKSSREKYTIDNPSLMEKMFVETARFVVMDMTVHLKKTIIDYMVQCINSYEEEIEEKDTDNYFYGLSD